MRSAFYFLDNKPYFKLPFMCMTGRRFKLYNKEFLGSLENVFKKRSCTTLCKSVTEDKNFKGCMFNSVVYSKGGAIYKEREKLCKVVKMLGMRPKRTVKVKWDFEKMVRLMHGSLGIKEILVTTFFFAGPISI
jgi:hypothetical protein